MSGNGQDSIFTYDSANWSVTSTVKAAYDKNGYIIVRQVLCHEEIAKVTAALEEPLGVQQHAYSVSDGKERKIKMALWKHAGQDITGVLARMEKVVDTMQQLMGGDEVYHYHAKLIMKEAKTGGTFAWHQDYGYWYQNGCLFPDDMGSVFIPLDDCTRDNGCLQVLKGSHRCGRIDHVGIGRQLQADRERVDQILKRLDPVYVELQAGDMLFFHSNLLHTSAPNTSEHRRWVFISCYNKRSNDPKKEHHHACYTPLLKVANSALMECQEVRNMEGKGFVQPEDDATIPKNVH